MRRQMPLIYRCFFYFVVFAAVVIVIVVVVVGGSSKGINEIWSSFRSKTKILTPFSPFQPLCHDVTGWPLVGKKIV